MRHRWPAHGFVKSRVSFDFTEMMTNASKCFDYFQKWKYRFAKKLLSQVHKEMIALPRKYLIYSIWIKASYLRNFPSSTCHIVRV